MGKACNVASVTCSVPVVLVALEVRRDRASAQLPWHAALATTAPRAASMLVRRVAALRRVAPRGARLLAQQAYAVTPYRELASATAAQREAWAAQDELLHARMKEHVPAALEHNGEESFANHLVGVQSVLRSWSASETLCNAALFHSIYGTEGFQGYKLPLSHREEIAGLIGPEAERLAWIFCMVDRATVDATVFAAAEGDWPVSPLPRDLGDTLPTTSKATPVKTRLRRPRYAARPAGRWRRVRLSRPARARRLPPPPPVGRDASLRMARLSHPLAGGLARASGRCLLQAGRPPSTHAPDTSPTRPRHVPSSEQVGRPVGDGARQSSAVA